MKGVSDLSEMNWFRNQVKNGAPWDYKQVGKQKGKPSPYEAFGNFNYGATGLATGLFTEFDLLWQAGRAQVAAGTSKPGWGSPGDFSNPLNIIPPVPPYGDDPDDQEQIKKGFEYYRAKAAGCA